MKKYDVKNCKIIEAKEIAGGIFDFTIFYPEFAWAAKPGQFAHIYLPGRTLRRPISICDIDKERGTLTRLALRSEERRGEGTAELAEFMPGTFLDVLAPLGKGFTLEEHHKKALFVGGGIGVPPLLAAAKHYGANASVAIGFRNAETVILEKDFMRRGVRCRLPRTTAPTAITALLLT